MSRPLSSTGMNGADSMEAGGVDESRKDQKAGQALKMPSLDGSMDKLPLLISCVLGIYTCYMAFGIVQEKL